LVASPLTGMLALLIDKKNCKSVPLCSGEKAASLQLGGVNLQRHGFYRESPKSSIHGFN
jgi:hypothetical protein